MDHFRFLKTYKLITGPLCAIWNLFDLGFTFAEIFECENDSSLYWLRGVKETTIGNPYLLKNVQFFLSLSIKVDARWFVTHYPFKDERSLANYWLLTIGLTPRFTVSYVEVESKLNAGSLLQCTHMWKWHVQLLNLTTKFKQLTLGDSFL